MNPCYIDAECESCKTSHHVFECVHTNDGIPHITCDTCAVKFIHPSLIAKDEDALTDMTADYIRCGESHKGGWITPCEDWVDRETVMSHASSCDTCRAILDDGSDLDDEYDVPPTKGGKPINNRMGTLNRVQGMLNRHRNAGRIK